MCLLSTTTISKEQIEIIKNRRHLEFNNAFIERKLDSVNSGLCDGFYATAQQFSNTNQNIFNGNAALQQTLCQGFSGVNQAIVTNGYETRLGINSLASQLAACCCDIRTQIADCCCTTQRGIDGINYNLATQACDIKHAINDSTRSILDFLTTDKIATLQAENQSLKFKASQAEQNAFITAKQTAQTAELIRRLGADSPVPAYVVPNPNCCYNPFGFNFNNGCGCA